MVCEAEQSRKVIGTNSDKDKDGPDNESKERDSLDDKGERGCNVLEMSRVLDEE